MAMGRNYAAGDSKALKLFLIYKAYDNSYNLENKKVRFSLWTLIHGQIF